MSVDHASEQAARVPLHPLAALQRDIWLSQKAWPRAAFHNVGGYLTLLGSIDQQLLRRALQHLINETPALRLRFIDRDGDVSQYVLDSFELHLPLHDMGSRHDPHTAVVDWMSQRFSLPLRIDDGELFEFSLLRQSAQRYHLMLRFHQLVMDARSCAMVVERLSVIFNAMAAHESIPPRQAPSFLRFIEEERRYLASEQAAQDETYWADTLGRLPPPLITPQQALVNATGVSPASLSLERLPSVLARRLRSFAQVHHCTLYQLVLTALVVYFHRVRGRSRVLVGVQGMGRAEARYKATLGPFATLSPLLIELEPTMPVEELLQTLHHTLRTSSQHQRVPLSRIAQRLGVLKRGRYMPFEVVCSHLRLDTSPPFATAPSAFHPLQSGEARHPLCITLCEFHEQDEVELLIEGSRACFQGSRLARFGENLRELLESMVEHPASCIANLELQGPTDQTLLQALNPAFRHRSAPSLRAQLNHALDTYADNTALEWADASLSYLELAHWSRRIANRLARTGIAPGALVAIAMHRSPELVASLMAVIQLGASWLPLDPEAPRDRTLNLLSQSNASVLLSRSKEGEHLVALHPQVLLLDDPAALHGITAERREVADEAGRIAYLLFPRTEDNTSKGVMVGYTALQRRLDAIGRMLEVAPSDRVGAHTAFVCDQSLLELLLPLLHGATLVLSTPGRLAPQTTASFLCERRITVATLVSSSLRSYVEALPNEAGSLRVACCYGDPLSAALANRFLALAKARLFNLYGPTEAVICATTWECEERQADQTLPIGRPCDQTSIHLLDENRQPLPVGEVGEICIGGSVLAEAYLGDDGLTTRRFIPDPFSPDPQARLFCSGDLGYLGEDGQLHRLSGREGESGEIDGYRLEAGQIEALLESRPGVRAALVSEQYAALHAYVVLDSGVGTDWHDNLARFLLARLPASLQPRTLTCLDALPLDPVSGRVEPSQLPTPTLHSMQTAIVSGPIQRQLLASWQQLLGLTALPSAQDNFFAEGGNAQILVELLSEIERICGMRLTPEAILEHPTLGAQAALIDTLAAGEGERTLVELTGGGHPCRTLYLCASGHGDTLRFTALAEAVGAHTRVKMLQPPDAVERRYTIEELAALYRSQLEPELEGDFFIGGFCIGGYTALELARQLDQRGCGPRAVMLFDTLYLRQPLTAHGLLRLLGPLLRLPGIAKWRLNGRRLDDLVQDRGLIVQLEALTRYRMSPWSGEVVLLVSRGLNWAWPLVFAPWERIFGERLHVERVEGRHAGMFQTTHLSSLVQVLDAWLSLDDHKSP